MYAVFSLLRRAAVSAIYVDDSDAKDGIKIEKDRDVLNLATAQWEKASTVRVYRLTASSESSGQSAVLLAQKENEIFRKAELESKYFTLLLGPEDSREDDGIFFRSSKIGVVRGIFRSPAYEKKLEPGVRKTQLVMRSPRRLPKGAILDER